VAQVDGGYSSGNWGEPAAWGCSVYYPVISNAGWGLGAWGSAVWGLGDGGLVSASDTVGYLAAAEASVSESASISDLVSRPSENISVSVIEAVNIADNLSGNVAVPVTSTVAETVNAADATSGNVTTSIVSFITEAANIADTTSANATFVVTVEETVNAESILSTLGIFVVTVDETGKAIDLVFPNGVYAQFINETVNAQDSVDRRRLWELIDTGTTEDWSLINTY
jgi:hypothetical protein